MAITNSQNLENLTESLILIILSFLPFKEAVRTSLLSRQWRDRWRSAGVVELNDGFFVDPTGSELEKQEQRFIFLEFARKWFSEFNGSSVRKFVVIFSKPMDVLTEMHDWISFALARNTEELTLDFSDPTWDEDDLYKRPAAEFELPALVYERSAILASLKLVFCNLDLYKFTNLGMLRELSLGWIELDDDLLDNLFKNCPLLESLTIENCWNFSRVIINNMSRLKKLIIDQCIIIGMYSWIQLDGVEGLQYLKYTSSVGYFRLGNQPFLEEAHLDFTMEHRFEDVNGEFLDFLLDQLQYARVLSVCSYLLQILPHHGIKTAFNFQNALNAKHLILKASLDTLELLGIKMLMKSCQSLEKITIEICCAEIFILDRHTFPHWALNESLQECFQHLKVVEVKGFQGWRNELKILRFFLSKGLVLEEVNIYIFREDLYHDEGATIRSFEKKAMKVHQLYKASPFVQINIY